MCHISGHVCPVECGLPSLLVAEDDVLLLFLNKLLPTRRKSSCHGFRHLVVYIENEADFWMLDTDKQAEEHGSLGLQGSLLTAMSTDQEGAGAARTRTYGKLLHGICTGRSLIGHLGTACWPSEEDAIPLSRALPRRASTCYVPSGYLEGWNLPNSSDVLHLLVFLVLLGRRPFHTCTKLAPLRHEPGLTCEDHVTHISVAELGQNLLQVENVTNAMSLAPHARTRLFELPCHACYLRAC